MSDYNKDRSWSDMFIPEIKRIVGPHLLDVAPFEIDAKRAADLIILRARDLNIACRVRRKGFLPAFAYEFTIRSARDSGADTELKKMVNGFGDWMFYGHAKEDHLTYFARWMLIDLSAWRAHLIMRTQKRLSISDLDEIPNRDGTFFRPFDIRSFIGEPNILIASGDLLENAA